MRRRLLVPVALSVLALGATLALAHSRGTPPAEALSLEDTGTLAVKDTTVAFTLYWPADASVAQPALFIFASDARATHPRPLRDWARAAAAHGVAAVYLEPTLDPAEAAARLQGVLSRHARTLGLDADAIWTWVEGSPPRSGAQRPRPRCGRRGLLSGWVAEGGQRLAVAEALLERALKTTGGRKPCPLTTAPGEQLLLSLIGGG
jgi:hypothetical protein